MLTCTGKLNAKALAHSSHPLSGMIQNLVKETNFELQRGKLHCTLEDWGSWSGSTNLATVKITDSIYESFEVKTAQRQLNK